MTSCIHCSHFDMCLPEYDGEYLVKSPRCRCDLGVWAMNFGDDQGIFRMLIKNAKTCKKMSLEEKPRAQTYTVEVRREVSGFYEIDAISPEEAQEIFESATHKPLEDGDRPGFSKFVPTSNPIEEITGIYDDEDNCVI